ncbi:unnamed protein product, partial [Staurois parvus]
RYRIVWLDSGHWVIRRDRIIRLDQFIRLGTSIRLGHQAEPRKAGSQTAGSPVWILAGWYWLERIFRFFLVLTTGALQVNAGLQMNGAAEDREELEDWNRGGSSCYRGLLYRVKERIGAASGSR